MNEGTGGGLKMSGSLPATKLSSDACSIVMKTGYGESGGGPQQW